MRRTNFNFGEIFVSQKDLNLIYVSRVELNLHINEFINHAISDIKPKFINIFSKINMIAKTAKHSKMT